MAKAKITAPIDPLEAAKAGAPLDVPSPLEASVQAAAASKGAQAAPRTGEAPPPPPTPAASSKGAEERGEPNLPPPAPARRLRRFQVERKVTVSWGSQMITLNPGDEVSEASYGPGSIERLREAGVALREVAH